MNINETVTLVHEIAKQKGWWDEERSALEIHALIHSEVSEATEEVRNNPGFVDNTNTPAVKFDGAKPEGHAVELADAVIRIMDYFGEMQWDLERVLAAKIAYNRTRPYRHGGKKY